MYEYVLTGLGMMAVSIRSDMNWCEIEEYIKENTIYEKPEAMVGVMYIGSHEFHSPKIYMAEDFINKNPIHL